LLIAIALALAIVLVYRVFLAPAGAFGEALAYAECPFRGDATVTVTSRVAPEDTFPVRMHEEVHAGQCRELGPFRYRLKNLTARGKLTLEGPGYCAGARARLSRGIDTARVRERVLDDATAAFKNLADSASVRAALHASCPEIVK
jgi:hypothetical protein